MTKYHSKKTTTIDGEVFDSRKEAMRWAHLCLLQKAGKISNLRRQVAFELIPAQWEVIERYGKNGQRLKDGKRLVEKSVTYVADFVYDYEGKEVVEDAKGYRTDTYVIKRKAMLFLKGIRILET